MPHSDEDAIQRVISRYSQSASQSDWAAVLKLFRRDAVWEIPHLGLKLDGIEAIEGALHSFFATMDYVLQINTPALIEVTGATATATSGIRECGKTAGKDEGFEYLGIYEDRLARGEEGWQFAYRTFRGLGSHFFPLVSGTAH